MKKIFTIMMLLLTVMVSYAAKPEVADFPKFNAADKTIGRHNAPEAEQASPVYLRVRKTTYDTGEFEWCYSGFNEEAYFGYAIYNEDGKEVAFTVLSLSETDYVTYLDNVTFKEYDEYECPVDNHYYISTYWILNSLNGTRFEDDALFAAHVMEVKDNDGNSILALRSGTYYLMVGEINFQYDEYGNITGASIGGTAKVQFKLQSVAVSDLKATVAADKKTAAISWTAPDASQMPAGAYLYLSVQSGSEVAFDNYSKLKESLANPLTVNVTEGRTYSVTAQYTTGKHSPLGSAVTTHFTVGTNEYIPTGLKATVTSDDYVEFVWSAAKKAEYYHVNVYKNGVTYASYTTQEQKLNKQIPTGKYSWEVAAYEKEEALFYPLTEYVKGNEFTTESAPLPEGVIEMNVWGINAAYIADESGNGKYAWAIIFETGAQGGTGLPEPWFAIYSDRELAISGNYSPQLGNLDISTTQGNGSFLNTNGSAAGLVQATSGNLRLNFEGFDTEYVMAGYSIPYYSGEFTMTCSDGKTYYGKFGDMLCPCYPMEEIASSDKNIISMLGEDGSQQGLEGVQSTENKVQKTLENGQVIIIREGVKYNVMGAKVQ